MTDEKKPRPGKQPPFPPPPPPKPDLELITYLERGAKPIGRKKALERLDLQPTGEE